MNLFVKDRILLRSAFLLAATLLIFSQNTFAQSNAYPGKWIKVAAEVDDISFIDSLNGVSFSGAFLTTSDGGKKWNVVDTTPIIESWAQPCLNAVACTGPSHAIVAKTNCDQVQLAGDSVFQTYCIGPGPDFNNWITLDMKMYDTSYGFRFVQITNRNGNALDTAEFLLTHDGWNSFEPFGGSLSGSDLASLQGSTQIGGATIVDSNEVWVGVHSTIYHTTNAGTTWDTIYPLAGTTYSSSQSYLYDFIISHATHEVYANMGEKPIDYLYSSDDGQTWQIDSVFKGDMARLSVVAPGVLWALVGKESNGNSLYLDPSPSYWLRSIAYSSNNGSTWSVDSTTFKVDSFLYSMYWFDARHGWIVADNYNPFPDTTDPRDFIWCYDADGDADVQTTIVGIKYGTIQVYPDPATNVLYLNEMDDALEIYDPLGRKYPVTANGNSLDISHLPSGVYFLYDGVAVRAKFLKE